MDVFDLFAKLTLDDGQYKESLEGDAEAGNSFASKVKGALGTAGKVGAAAIGAVTAASAAFSGAIVKGVGDVASYGDNIDKMSQKMGMSAQAYQEWDAIMQHSGTSIDSMARGMTTLSKAAENGSDAFQALGISQEEIASMSQEELVAKTIEGLQNMESGTERTVLAQKLLGGASKELGALLNTSAEDTEAMRQRVHELGGVMSDEAIKSAAAYQDQLQDMQTAFQGISRGLMSNFLPSLTTVMSGLTEIFGGNGDAGVALVTEGVNGIIKGLTEAMPRIAEVGGSILTAIGSAIQQNIPAIIGAGTQIILDLGSGLIAGLPGMVSIVMDIGSTIIETILANAPALIDSGMELIGDMADGILSGAPQAISSFFTVLSRLVSYIAQNLPQFLSKGVELVGRIASGIIQNLPAIVSAIAKGIAQLLSTIASNAPQFLSKGSELVGKIASGLGQAIPQLLSAIGRGITQMLNRFKNTNWASVGLDIMRGVADGIRNGLSGALTAMGNAAKNLLDKAKKALKIGSPSKVFRDMIGMNIGAGIAEGILASIPMVDAAMDDMDDELLSGMDDVDFGTDTVVTSVGDKAGSASNKTVNNNFTIHVDGTENPEQFADRMVKELQLKVRMA